MGVSFKVSKVGKRYNKPKELLLHTTDHHIQTSNDSINEGKLEKDDISNYTKQMAASTQQQVPEELEVSFSVNLFLDGFCVGKPKEVLNNVPKQLLPYDRASEALFTAIEYGRLPGDIFDEIPFKYFNGAVLCEIKDYRGAGLATDATSPITHKVLLQMCMENVVKDISSTSDKSWTYEVLLEVESRILKALQPDLQLNPGLLLNRSSGELSGKKINLGMNWGSKKRKLNDALECNSQHFINMQNIRGIQNSKSQTGLVNHGHEIQVSQNDTARAVPSLQVDSEGLEKIQPIPLRVRHNDQLSHGCQRPASVDFFSSPTNSSRRGRESLMLVPSETTRCQAQPMEGLILKKPKQEPEEFLLQQLPGDGAKNAGAPELSSNNTSHLQVEAGKVLHERFSHQRGFCSITNKGEPVPQGNPKLPLKMSSSTVNQQPAGTTKLSDSYVRQMKDKPLTLNMSARNVQQSSSPLKANCYPANTVEKVPRNDKITQKRKVSSKPSVTAGIKSSPSRSFNGNSLVEAPLQAKQENNIPRVSSTKMTADALASTGNIRTADRRSTLGNPHPGRVSSIEGNFYPKQRFEKIGLVTKRYKLNDKKKKSGPLFPKEPFGWTPLASLHRASFVNHAIADGSTSMSECSISRELNISKTRTLTFVHQSYVCQRNENSQLDYGNPIKLVISEKVNEGKVEAIITYGVEETAYTSLTFPSISFANLFAAQFQSLVVNEGYCIAQDLIEPRDVNSFGNGLNSPSQTTDGSTSKSPAFMRDRISTLDPRQSSFGRHMVPSVNLEILPSNLSEFQLQNADQVAPTWSGIWTKRANLQFQMMERQRLREQIVRNMMIEDGLGRTQLSGGFPGVENKYMALAGRHIEALQIANSGMLNTANPQIGNINIGQFSNPGSNWNPQNQQFPFGVQFDQSTSLPAWQGEVTMNGFWTQNRNPEVQMRGPSFADMAYQMNNQQLSQEFENSGPFPSNFTTF
ncbi:Protein PHYTOCHROME-DEPENDENT LATE-FLOWERING [Euphorbia peplus]|nr:Protein PHYTOCHROME-DEPENDENT LATE-FLOWERING [Euphorbia peplus]